MSDPHAPAPPHGHPQSTIPTTNDKTDSPATASHPPPSAPDPTATSAQSHSTASDNAREGGLPAASSSGATKLANLKVADAFHTTTGEKSDIDIVVGLESRGFLFGPTLALKLGAGFVPIRKKGKLPGKTVTEGFKKEYGEDFFQIQSDAIRPGQKVVIVDDIIATGGTAAAAGNLVKHLGGKLLGYVFMMELDFLKGREKLDAPVHTLLSGQEEALK